MTAVRTTPRRGIAMLAALWLIVAIATVATQFALTARERRIIGLGAADRGKERALVAGALATLTARMESDLRNRTLGSNVGSLRASDPWLGIDSIYSGVLYVDSMPVTVIAEDLGAKLNINLLAENEMRVFFGFVVGNASTADLLAGAIMDWRDQDDTPRLNGGEYEQYMDEGRLVLPTNGMFREVDDLIHVRGMTPEILAMLRPYITTYGSARVNLNTAPEPVLRALPGMNDLMLGQILGLRSQGRRIESLNQVMSSVNRVATALRGRGAQGRGQTGGNAVTEVLARQQEQLSSRTTVDTRDVLLTFHANLIPKTQPTRLLAYIVRSNNTSAALQWQLW